MKVSIVIPNYNGEHLLRTNLPQIISASGNCEIIIVDDGSKDGSCQLIDKHFPQIKIIPLGKNYGFATAVNTGVKNSSGELVMLLNSDVIPQKNYLNPLVKHFQDLKVFAAGSLQRTGKEWQSQTSQGRGIGKFSRGFLVHSPGRLDKPDTLWVFAAAAMYRKSIWESLGGMNEIYNPFYWEDIDISYRALKLGYKIIFEPKSMVHHSQGQSIESSFKVNKIKQIVYRNQILFIWLNITDFRYLFSHILYLPYHVVRSILVKDFSFINGLLMAVIKLSGVLRFRRHSRRTLLTDKRLLEQFVS